MQAKVIEDEQWCALDQFVQSHPGSLHTGQFGQVKEPRRDEVPRCDEHLAGLMTNNLPEVAFSNTGGAGYDHVFGVLDKFHPRSAQNKECFF